MHYKIEYEGLHILYLRCGCFGHFKEGCVDQAYANGKNMEIGTKNASDDGRAPTLNHRVKEDGPWTLIQKSIRTRKSKGTGTKNLS